MVKLGRFTFTSPHDDKAIASRKQARLSVWRGQKREPIVRIGAGPCFDDSNIIKHRNDPFSIVVFDDGPVCDFSIEAPFLRIRRSAT